MNQNNNSNGLGIINDAVDFIGKFAEDKVGLSALRDPAITRELVTAMQDAGLLHPGGDIETFRVHGVVSEDGRVVQRVAGRSDPDWDKAGFYVRSTIETPWRAETSGSR